MPSINRNNVDDAKKQIEDFLPDKNIRTILLKFLAESIIFADRLNKANWNLNLDKNGKFLRFNTGQEYCIEISHDKTLVLCIREILRKNIKGRLDIEFHGYSGKSKIISKNLDDTPDCLVKVPDSVGCNIGHENIIDCLPFVKEANKIFIDTAIRKTILLPQIEDAHSVGGIEYLSMVTNEFLPNPSYTLPTTEKDFMQSQERLLVKAKKMNTTELEKKALRAVEIPKKTTTTSTQYVRNVFVSEFIKRQARGICQDCEQPAPFVSKQNGEPFLETHHILTLADGGKDIIDNVVALCPNCHRKRHYG